MKEKFKLSARDIFEMQIERANLIQYIQDCQFVGKITNETHYEHQRFQRQPLIHISKFEREEIHRQNRLSFAQRVSTLNIEDNYNINFKQNLPERKSMFDNLQTKFTVN